MSANPSHPIGMPVKQEKERKRRRHGGWAPALGCVLAALALLLAFGANARAQEGDTPVTAVAIGAGTYHTCAVTSDGGVQCWGNNDSGQLGVARRGGSRYAPVDVAGFGPDTQATAVAGGHRHTCAITGEGDVKCWGSNEFGQLGAGFLGSDYSAPLDVAGFGSGEGEAQAVAITGGYSFTCALTSDDEVKCWGRNDYGQLGDGTESDQSRPVHVKDDSGNVVSNVKTIAGGIYHVCAITDSENVICWGRNDQGQLGNGEFNNSSTPVDVVDAGGNPIGGVQALVAGGEGEANGIAGYSCAATGDGAVLCWGYEDARSPTPVDGLSNVQALSAGRDHACALIAGGDVMCWGDNFLGQLGNGTRDASDVPVYVNSLGTDAGEAPATAIVSGRLHTCALTANGGVKCWGGEDRDGQLGRGLPNASPTPVDVFSLQSGVEALDGGNAHTCAVVDGSAICWGDNQDGQLGDGTQFGGFAPKTVTNLSGVQTIAAGGHVLIDTLNDFTTPYQHTCALVAGGVKCWGDNSFGQLGNGAGGNNGDRSTTPVDVTGLTSGVQAVTVGAKHSCALIEDGSVECWGENLYGQLGEGSTDGPYQTPVNVVGFGPGDDEEEAIAIAAGSSHTCALTEDGGVKCWGFNMNGQLGNDSNDNSPVPVDVANLDSGVQAIAAGGDVSYNEEADEHEPFGHTCALTDDGAVKCWGSNSSGQLGDGTLENRDTPTSIFRLSSGVRSIAAGGLHTCAVLNDNSVRCWGDNWYGQLGDGTLASSAQAVMASGLQADAVRTVMATAEIQMTDARTVTAGSNHTCIQTTAGGVKCWGNNEFGQLGAELPGGETPIYVVGLEGVYSISGRVTLGGAGLAGVTVSAGGQSATTGADGDYTIAAVPAGEQTVTPSLGGYTFDPASRQVTLDADITGVDFTAQVATYTLSGRITTAGGAGAPGVTVTIGAQSDATNANGEYSIGRLPGGSHTLYLTMPGYTVSPATKEISLPLEAGAPDGNVTVVLTENKVFLPAIQP